MALLQKVGLITDAVTIGKGFTVIVIEAVAGQPPETDVIV